MHDFAYESTYLPTIQPGMTVLEYKAGRARGPRAWGQSLPSFYRHLAGDRDARDMPNPDDTYIVRVRRDEGDAIVEDVRSPRNRRHVRNLSELGALIKGWQSPRTPRRPGRKEDS